jgi:hypothetical protein
MKQTLKLGTIFLLLLSISLTGCASKKSLRVTKTNEIICSNQSVEDTYRFLVKGLRVHYTGSEELTSHTDVGMFATGTIFVPMPGTIYIENEYLGNNKYEIYVSVKNGISPKMIGELIEIKKINNSCKTTIKINYMNGMWKRHGVFVKKILGIIN